MSDSKNIDKLRKVKRLVFESDGQALKVALFLGLKWRAVASKGLESQVAKLAADGGAKQFVAVKTSSGAKDAGMAAGMLELKPLEEGVSLPKKLASAAAVFAHTVGKEHPDAALAVRLPSGSTYVVVLSDGVPIVDLIDTDGNSLEAVNNASVIYTDDVVQFAGGTQIDLDWLVQAAEESKEALLKPVPSDPRAVMAVLVGGLVVGLVVTGGYYYLQQKEKAAKQKELAAQIAASPGPKYTGALYGAKQGMMVTATQWRDTFSAIEKLPVTAAGGWIREKITCAAEVCSSDWIRKGASTQELTSALASISPGEKVQPALIGEFDRAVSVLPVPNKAGPFNGTFKTMPDWLKSHATLIQNWRTANLSPQIKPSVLWPQVPEVPSSFRAADTLGATPIEVNAKGAFVKEILDQTPADLSWKTIAVQLKPGADEKDRVIVTMTGVIYVSLQ